MLNKDGLEVGVQIDFATIQRVNRERKQNEQSKTTKRKADSDGEQVQNIIKPTRKKKT